MSIRMKILFPVFLILIVSFAFFILYLILDQSNIKNKELAKKMENFTQLIAMTNVTNVWNMNMEGIEINIASFMNDREVISIDVKDSQNTSLAKKANDIKKELILRKADILHESGKIGTVEIQFTDYYIRKDIGGIAFQLLALGFSIFALISGCLIVITNLITTPIRKLTDTASRIADGETGLLAVIPGQGEITKLADSFNSMTEQLQHKADIFKKTSDILLEIVNKVKDIIVSLNSASKEIEAASQEQMTASNEHASGITEVSATLQELTITAKQITNNVGELVYSSGETIKLLQGSEKELMKTVTQLDEAGNISKENADKIGELGKRSAIINEMVELIKDVANKTNILSINASIEASRSGDSGAGFSVVAAEIRELSRETIESAKKAEVAAREISNFLDAIIVSTGNESAKVIGSGKTMKSVFDSMEEVVSKINSNYSFTQKIDVSIKQQESGSSQASDTMRQMAEIARQSAEIARQTLSAAKDIVSFGEELDRTVMKIDTEEKDASGN